MIITWHITISYHHYIHSQGLEGSQFQRVVCGLPLFAGRSLEGQSVRDPDCSVRRGHETDCRAEKRRRQKSKGVTFGHWTWGSIFCIFSELFSWQARHFPCDCWGPWGASEDLEDHQFGRPSQLGSASKTSDNMLKEPWCKHTHLYYIRSPVYIVYIYIYLYVDILYRFVPRAQT